MFTILHGDHLLASRKALEVMKKTAEKKEVISFDGKKVTLTDLKQALEARSLFGQEKLAIVENLISLKYSSIKTQEQVKRTFDYLKALPSNTELILWEKKKIDGRRLISFKNAKIQLFQTPAIIFKFLESIQPNNQESMLSLFENCAKTGPVELIFYMIVRQFRLLLLVKDLGKEGVRMAPWQYARLTNQANCFTLEKLLKIYKKLLKIDYQQKTGQLVFDLKKTIELLLVNL
ncbi:hypothetical protein ISS85_01055 [Candidatus Microgenomates bacterium]|nr:hypothetical protein [Candidatus Microgenomates bacterium]